MLEQVRFRGSIVLFTLIAEFYWCTFPQDGKFVPQLGSRDLLHEIESLPQLIMRIPTPALDPSGYSDTEESDSDELPAPPTRFSLSTETKKLYREVMKYSSVLI